VVAGSIYPILVAAIYLCVGIVLSFVQRSSSGAFLLSFSMFMAAIWYTVIVAVIGLLWAAVVCLAVFPLVYFFISSLDLRGSIVSLGAYCGGLVGFAAVLPFLMLVLVSEHSEGLWAGVLLLAFGPCLTTVLGQLGGAWGGRRATQSSDKWYLEQLAIANVSINSVPAVHVNAPAISQGLAHKRMQFGIRQLMWVAVWLSLLLSFIRLSGIPFAYMLPLLTGWLLYQAATLWIGRQLLRYGAWVRSRRGRGNNRST